MQIINCILKNERRVLSVSSYDDCTDTYNGFPAVVGREGLIRRLTPKLTEDEGIKFQKSVNTLKNTLKEVLNV